MRGLPPEDVHVWAVDLAGPEAEWAPRERILSPEERARAARFLQPADRRRFIVAHAALREILGSYLSRPPAELAFAVGPHGKPRLAESGTAWLRFNLSHSHEAGLIACAREREVGADIEWMRDSVDCAEIVERFFSPAEREEWAAVPPDGRHEAFFRGWTHKEAYVKGLGNGLSHSSQAYTVRLAPALSSALLADTLRPGTESGWSLHAVPAPAGYAAAVAVAGPAARIVLGRWEGKSPDFSSKPAAAVR